MNSLSYDEADIYAQIKKEAALATSVPSVLVVNSPKIFLSLRTDADVKLPNLKNQIVHKQRAKGDKGPTQLQLEGFSSLLEEFQTNYSQSRR